MKPTTAADSAVSEDGLRYVRRGVGSLFGSISTSSSMSCFWCGKHRAARNMTTKRILTKNQKICGEVCIANPAFRKLQEAGLLPNQQPSGA